jgi:hypothetical protein
VDDAVTNMLVSYVKINKGRNVKQKGASARCWLPETMPKSMPIECGRGWAVSTLIRKKKATVSAYNMSEREMLNKRENR